MSATKKHPGALITQIGEKMGGFYAQWLARGVDYFRNTDGDIVPVERGTPEWNQEMTRRDDTCEKIGWSREWWTHLTGERISHPDCPDRFPTYADYIRKAIKEVVLDFVESAQRATCQEFAEAIIEGFGLPQH